MRLLFILILFIYSCTNESLDKQYLNMEADEQEIINFSKAEFRAKEAKFLVVHCTATDPSRPWGKERLLSFFKDERGWNRPGYNYYITQDGEIHELAPIDDNCLVDFDEVVYGVRGYNSTTFNISLEGGVINKNRRLIIEDNFTLEQKLSLAYLVEKIKTNCPGIKVVGHRDLDKGKACPVLNIDFLY